MVSYFGLPRVWSTDVGLLGKRRKVVPCLRVWPMGVIPAVRLAQVAARVITCRAGFDRLLSKTCHFDFPNAESPQHVPYIDNLSSFRVSPEAVNKELRLIIALYAAAGLPCEAEKSNLLHMMLVLVKLLAFVSGSV